MDFLHRQNKIFITCNKRLAPYLHKEILQLGYTKATQLMTGVEINGSWQDCIRLNLQLRCASQVMYSIKQFTCNSVTELYNNLLEIEWENIVPSDGYFSVNSNVYHPGINNEMFANVKVKDAVADRIRNTSGTRPHSGPHLLNSVLYLYWKNDKAEIFIDTSGETLAKHGYRKIPGKAPMMESLAAATLLSSLWNATLPFVNPMCGSGTLAIEAALLATGRAPGLFRKNYGFMHIIGYEESEYLTEKKLLDEQITAPVNLQIIATDVSTDAIEIAKVNAAIAGVEKYIDFAVCDFADTTIPTNTSGVVMLNPEYGERLGQEVELEETYARIGDFLKKKCQNYLGYIFTGNLVLAKKIGLKTSRRIEFYNGKIDCRLLEYELYIGSKRTDKRE